MTREEIYEKLKLKGLREKTSGNYFYVLACS